MPEARRGRGRRAPHLRVGRARAQVLPRPDVAVRLAARRVALLSRPASSSTSDRRLPGHFDMPTLAASRRTPARLQPARVSVRRARHRRGRWRPALFRARVLKAVDARGDANRGPRRRRDRGHTRTTSRSSSPVCRAHAICGVLRSVRPKPLFRPGWSPTRAVPLSVPRQADPASRARHDPRSRRPRSGLPFRIVGAGQLDSLLDGGVPANVERTGWVERDTYPGRAVSAGCALGIFGTTRPVWTASSRTRRSRHSPAGRRSSQPTRAARELLVDGETRLLIPPAIPRRSRQRSSGSPTIRRSRSASPRRPGVYEDACESLSARRTVAFLLDESSRRGRPA